MIELLSGLLFSNGVVLGALATILVAFVAWLIVRWSWMRHVAELAILAYKYAERQGLLQGVQGYDKIVLFMDYFVERFRDKYGKDPAPSEIGHAVKAMEEEVRKEDHSYVLDPEDLLGKLEGTSSE